VRLPRLELGLSPSEGDVISTSLQAQFVEKILP
jgi:hypothetical protein